MGICKDKSRGDWIYKFQHNGKSYGGRGFRTKAEARAAREERRKEIKKIETEAPESVPETPLTFLAACTQYLEWSQRRHAAAHIENKKVVFRKLGAFLEKDIPIVDLTPSLIHNFLSERPTNNAYNVYRKELSAFFNWIPKHFSCQAVNPCINLEKMPNPRKERKIPTRQEFMKLLAAAGPEERPLLLVLVHTLARIDEILRLTWQDVNFEKGILALWSRKNRSGEWKLRAIPMNPDLQGMLFSMWKRRMQEKWIFYNERAGDRYLRRPKFMRSLCKRAGIPHYGFHPVRHFVATYMHDVAKIPTGILSGILGHENKRTTEIYLHSVDEAHRAALLSVEGLLSADFLVSPLGVAFEGKEPTPEG